MAALALVSAVFCGASAAVSPYELESVTDKALLTGEFYEAETLQDILDGYCTENAGGVSEFLVMVLLQYREDLDYSKYASAAHSLLPGKGGAVNTRMKATLAAWASGGVTADEAAAFASESAGHQGIISWIYSLFILSNVSVELDGLEPQINRCVDEITSAQGESGGWGLSPDKPSPDVTAMALQALAAAGLDETSDSVNRGVEYLSLVQLSDGGYASFGDENSESCSQVVIALSALDIDPDVDERFSKGGKTPIQALLDYRTDTGSFSHKPGGEANFMATTQAAMALVSYRRMITGREGFFTFDIRHEMSVPAAENDPVRLSGQNIRMIASAVIMIFVTAVLIFRLKKGRITRVDAAICMTVCVLVCGFLAFSTIETPEEYYSHSLPAAEEGSPLVSFGIDKRGEILLDDKYVLFENDTVLSILIRAAGAAGIPVDYSGGADAYIYGIDGLSAGEFGPMSGWMYSVNSVAPGVGCGRWKPQDGDTILFYYVEDYSE